MKKTQKYISPPKTAEKLLKRIFPDSGYNSPVGDFEEVFKSIQARWGKLPAILWYWFQLVVSLKSFVTGTIYWRFIMFKNYLKVAVRNLLKHKTYSAINILGLTGGIAASIFIYLFVSFELSYDNYHEGADRVYRVALEQKTSAGDRYYSAVNYMVGKTLKDQFSQVEAVTGIQRLEPCPVKYADKIYLEDKLDLADPGLFDVFSIKFIEGTPAGALDRPLTVVITEQAAAKYFGYESAVGKILVVDTLNFEVTGVIENSPGNTHYKFGMIGSIKTLVNHPFRQGWSTGMHSDHTYFRIQPGTDTEELTARLNQIAYTNLKEELDQFGYTHNYFLQPLKDIHLSSNLRGEVEPPGSSQILYIFSAAGFLILLIAGMNFMNLSTARSAGRSGEVGIRKVFGAFRAQLIWQFIGESLVITFISFIAALILVVAAMPLFNELSGLNFEPGYLMNPKLLSGFLVTVLITGLAAGSYPAFFLSAFNPVSILKGKLKAGSKGVLMRKILVTGQFAISIFLIIGTLSIFQQLNYMKNKPLGFDIEQKLIISMPRFSMLRENYESVKSKLLQHTSIKGAAASSSIPGRWMFFWRIWPTGKRAEQSQSINFMNVDYDFLDIYEIEITAGRPFKRTMGTDADDGGMIMNEAAVKSYGILTPEEAIGKLYRDNATQVIGVSKDFHFKGLQSSIEPIAMSIWPDHFKYITLKVDTGNLQETIAYVKGIYHEFFPGEMFDYFFLDADFYSQYQSEEKTSRLFSVFTIIGIFIAGLGLFGLSSFIAEQRTKEIGIRKVLGAPVPGIVALLSKEFIKWVMISTIIAWPVAYFASNSWLQGFAYRTNLGWAPFVLSAFAALLIAVLTVSGQSIKAARANPVKTLRYE
jgi:putative ABC transport system permease protein